MKPRLAQNLRPLLPSRLTLPSAGFLGMEHSAQILNDGTEADAVVSQRGTLEVASITDRTSSAWKWDLIDEKQEVQ